MATRPSKQDLFSLPVHDPELRCATWAAIIYWLLLHGAAAPKISADAYHDLQICTFTSRNTLEVWYIVYTAGSYQGERSGHPKIHIPADNVRDWPFLRGLTRLLSAKLLPKIQDLTTKSQCNLSSSLGRFRVKDLERSLDFYTRILGFTVLEKLDFAEAKFSLVFLGQYSPDEIPDDPADRVCHPPTWSAISICKSRQGSCKLTASIDSELKWGGSH